MTKKFKPKLLKERASETIEIFLTEEECAEIEERAKSHNLTLSGHIRAAALACPVHKNDTTELIIELFSFAYSVREFQESDPNNEPIYQKLHQAIQDAIVAILWASPTPV